MDWVQPFFDTVSEWWGRPKPRQSDLERLAVATRFAPRQPMRVLELGAGGGTTTVVTAEAGHSVTAVELSPARVTFIRDLVRERDVENAVTVVQGDIHDVDAGGPFDCVMYWNGFGIGSDADQRRLLSRVHDEWLVPEGIFVLDVFSPFRWARVAGQRIERKAVVELVNTNDYDPVTSRFFDTWWPAGHEDEAVTQSARCYTPGDFELLLHHIGMEPVYTMAQGVEFDRHRAGDRSHPLWDAWSYTCVLKKTPAPASS